MRILQYNPHVHQRCVALGFAVVLAVFEIGSCLKCFQCDSHSDPSCSKSGRNLVDCSSKEVQDYIRNYLKDYLPSKIMEDVKSPPGYCLLIVMESGLTIRSCINIPDPSQSSKACSALGDAKQCRICNQNSCNGAGSMTASAPIALFALITAYLYSKQ